MNVKTDLQLVGAARCLLFDQLAVDVTSELASQGVEALVLKGASFAGWLWRGEHRPYGDLDLLVAPSAYDQAGRLLAELGFVDPAAMARPSEVQHNGRPWIRIADRLVVDLHRAIVGVRVSDAEAWEILAAHRAPLPLGSSSLWQLDESARTLHVALHAAQHGPREAKPLDDLRRALDQVPLAGWQDAVDLARELDALPALAGGMRLLEPGRDLARRLDVDRHVTVDVVMRLQSSSQVARGIARFAGTAGVSSKISLVLDRIRPSPTFLRKWTPIARRGRMGLAVAYIWRNVYLVLQLVPGIVAWRRAERMVKRLEATPQTSDTRPARDRATSSARGRAPRRGRSPEDRHDRELFRP